MERPILYYGISGRLGRKIDKYIQISGGEPLLIIEKPEIVEEYHDRRLFDKYEVVTVDEALERFPEPVIWVTFSKAIKSARLLGSKVGPENVHFFEADLEYRQGCSFLGHFISYRRASFSPCCIVSKYPYIMVEGSVEERLEQWKEFETGLIDDIRNNRPNGCTGCPHLVKDFWHKTVKLDMISFGTCQPGDVCNYKCVYCFAEEFLNNPEKDNENMSTYQVIEQLSQMPEYNTPDFKLNISNGEFTANKDCDDMLDILLRMPWKVSFLTNGSIYREKFAEFLKTGRALKVQISMDAGTRETYHKVKGLDAFDRVIENMKRYELGNVDGFVLKYIFLEGYNDNEADTDGFIDVAAEVGCRSITISSDLFKPFTPKMRTLVTRMIKRAADAGIKLRRNMSYVTNDDARFMLDTAGESGNLK